MWMSAERRNGKKGNGVLTGLDAAHRSNIFRDPNSRVSDS
jgi:hypothetical protein